VALSFLLLVGAGAASQRPVVGGNPGMGIGAPSCGESCAREVPWSNWRIVSPDYFRALGLPLVAGRGFDERDKSVWADSGQSNLDAEVVGVVGDMRDRGLASEPTRTVYLPYGMNALPGEVVIQTRGDPLALVPTVRSIVAALDPNLPMADMRSFDNVVDRSVAPERLNTLLPGVFGSLALLLATAGICGVLSYSMSRRTSEIGLRVALGATGGRILRMAVGQGMRGCCRHCARYDRRVPAEPVFHGTPIRRQGVRSPDLRSRRRAAARYCARRLLSTGPARHAHRSGHGSADRLIPTGRVVERAQPHWHTE
jgi:hypothetical protein